MSLLRILDRHLSFMTTQMVDSALLTTRVFWRVEYCNATEAEANDPRPFAEVLRDRTGDRTP